MSKIVSACERWDELVVRKQHASTANCLANIPNFIYKVGFGSDIQAINITVQSKGFD